MIVLDLVEVPRNSPLRGTLAAAHMLSCCGRWNESIERCEAALLFCAQSGDISDHAYTMLHMAEAYVIGQCQSEAARKIKAAVNLLRIMGPGHAYALICALWLQGEVFASSGHIEQAVASMQSANAVAESLLSVCAKFGQPALAHRTINLQRTIADHILRVEEAYRSDLGQFGRSWPASDSIIQVLPTVGYPNLQVVGDCDAADFGSIHCD